MREKITEIPHLMDEWDWEKNGEEDLYPFNITAGSHKPAHWICKTCGYKWKVRIADRVNGTGCPCCANKSLVTGINDLKTKYPQIAAEWHPTKNGNLKPDEVLSGSKDKVWWQCNVCKYEWPATIQNRTKENGTGCPCCSGNVLVPGVNDLQTVRPDIAAQWHPELNDELRPDMYMPCSDEEIWWLCSDCGHVWYSKIRNRTKGKSLTDGRGCPECSKHLQTSFPEQAIYYYVKQAFPDAINRYTELGFELDVYIPSFSIAIEYDGVFSHIDKGREDAVKNQKCINAGIKLIRIREQGLNEFSDCICFTRNISEKLSMNPVIERLLKFLGVPEFDVNVERDSQKIKESYRGIVRKNSLAECFPNIALQWHPTKNGKLTPYMFAKRSNDSVWWLCPDCGHEWRAVIADRTRAKGTGCPECGKKKRVESLMATLEKKKSNSLNRPA